MPLGILVCSGKSRILTRVNYIPIYLAGSWQCCQQGSIELLAGQHRVILENSTDRSLNGEEKWLNQMVFRKAVNRQSSRQRLQHYEQDQQEWKRGINQVVVDLEPAKPGLKNQRVLERWAGMKTRKLGLATSDLGLGCSKGTRKGKKHDHQERLAGSLEKEQTLIADGPTWGHNQSISRPRRNHPPKRLRQQNCSLLPLEQE
ncbi:hypothetical protein NE237_012145 [Protea cynaroides]|uniref:Uncharacterized protein n=1 Tax=Protea cynaroides TaxID=273540 RepID=A0A9Q0H0I6_9MAGN|nr:hypothetical protein NE237_012145 [Protea cynaroides]